MIIYPAIDLSKGEIVRLEKGDFEKKTIYSTNVEKQVFYHAKTDHPTLNRGAGGYEDIFDIVLLSDLSRIIFPNRASPVFALAHMAEHKA